MRTIVTAGLLLLGSAGWGLCGDGPAVCQVPAASPPATTAAAALPLSADGAAIHAEIQRLDRVVRLAREELGRAIEEGTRPRPGLAEDADGWLDLLDRLARDARHLGGSEGPYLAAKAAAVRRFAEDVVRHAGDATGDPQPGAGPPLEPSPTRRTQKALQAAPNDDCANAIPIGHETVTGETLTATNDGNATCGDSDASPDVWYRTSRGLLFVSTVGSDFDTVVSLHTACPNEPESRVLACNDDSFGLQASLSYWDWSMPDEVYIRVSGAANAAGNFVLTVGYGGGSVRGIVTDSSSGLPVADTAITAYTIPGWASSGAQTAADGSYQFVTSSLGQVKLKAVDPHDGYLNEVYDGLRCPFPDDPDCSNLTGTLLDLSEPDSVVTADFSLDPAARVSGEVTNEVTGLPVDSWTYPDLYDESGQLIASASTHSSWVTGELPSGTYHVVMGASGYRPKLFDDIPWGPGAETDPTSGMPILAREGETTGGVDFALQPELAVSGTVTDALSGAYVRYAYVQFFAEDGSEASSCRTSGYSFNLGHYSCYGMTPGRYALFVSDDRYRDVLYPDVPCEGGPGIGCSLTDGTLLDLSGEQDPLAGVDVALQPLAFIAGRVTSESTGEPLPGIKVEAGNFGETYPYVSARTNTEGEYSLGPLWEDAYWVRIADGVEFVEEVYDDVPCVMAASSSNCSVTGATLVEVAPDRPATGIDMALVRGSSISGRVTDSVSGDGVPYVYLRLQGDAQGQGTFRTSGTSHADGTFTLLGLPPGRYFLAADESPDHLGALYDGLPCPTGPADGCNMTSGTPIDLTSPTPHDLGGIALALTAKGGISGRVTRRDTGESVTSATVKVWNELGESVTYVGVDSAGEYRIRGLQGGSYYVTVQASGGLLSQLYDGIPCDDGTYSLPCSMTAGTPVQVALGHVTSGVDLSLAPGATVTGSITDHSTGEALSGTVTLWRDQTLIASDQTWNGNYSFSGMPGGSYRLLLDPGSGYLGQIFDGVDCAGQIPCSASLGTPVELVEGETTSGIDFHPLREGSLRGVVVSKASGAAVAALRVRLLTPRGSLVSTRVTSATGEFSFPSLRPGDYIVETDSVEFINQVYNGISCLPTCPLDRADPVRVEAERDTRHVDFQLERKAAISGRVVDAVSGEPLADRTVTAYTTAGTSERSAHTDENGDYRISGLVTGAHYVAASGGNDHVLELFDGLTCESEQLSSCLPLATRVPLEPDTERGGIDFAMHRWGTISGRVTTNRTQAPVICTVYAYDAETHELVKTATTSSVSGAYSLTKLKMGSYLLYATSTAIVPELYDGTPCAGGLGVGCTLEAGLPVDLSPATPDRTGIDFAVDSYGSINVHVRSAHTGDDLLAHVDLFDADGGLVASRYSQTFRFNGLTDGTYFVAAQRVDFTTQVFDGISCPDISTSSCDLRLATPIEVSLNDAYSLNIDLVPMTDTTYGTLVTTVVSKLTGGAIKNARVQLWTSAGTASSYCYTSADGNCTVSVPEGTYFATVERSGFASQLYDGFACPSGCSFSDVTHGTPIPISVGGGNTLQVMMADAGPAIVGRVSSEDGIGVPAVFIDVWDAAGGTLQWSTCTDADGFYRVSAWPGTFYVSTDNGQGLEDEVFDDVVCPDGPAYAGLCDPVLGTRLVITYDELLEADFVLARETNPIFGDGFEDGTSGRWSATVGR